MQEWNGEELEVEDLVERLAVAEEEEEEEEKEDEEGNGEEDEEDEPFWRTYL